MYRGLSKIEGKKKHLPLIPLFCPVFFSSRSRDQRHCLNQRHTHTGERSVLGEVGGHEKDLRTESIPILVHVMLFLCSLSLDSLLVSFLSPCVCVPAFVSRLVYTDVFSLSLSFFLLSSLLHAVLSTRSSGRRHSSSCSQMQSRVSGSLYGSRRSEPGSHLYSVRWTILWKDCSPEKGLPASSTRLQLLYRSDVC